MKIFPNKTFIIAEVGLNHMGNFKLAKKYITEFSKTGIDAIKFQAHMADFESTNQEKFRIKFSQKYKNRYDYWKKTSFSKKQWSELYKFSKKNNLKFGVSVFCNEALKLFDNGKYVDFFKVPSGETNTYPLLKNISKLNKFTIISTGLSDWKEINSLTKIFKNKKKFFFLQCTSKYPNKLNEVGFNVIEKIKNKYGYKCGLSDHTGNISTALMAISKKTDILEFHVKINEKGDYPDKSISLNLKDVKFIIKTKNDFLILNTKVNKNLMFKKLLKTKKLFGKSLSLKENLKKNQKIKESNIILKKPGTGIQYKYLKKF